MIELDFDLGNISRYEFGVHLRFEGESKPCMVPTSWEVLPSFLEIAQNTLHEMQRNELDPRFYEPSEKYASREHVTIRLDDDLAHEMRLLFEADLPPCPVDAR